MVVFFMEKKNSTYQTLKALSLKSPPGDPVLFQYCWGAKLLARNGAQGLI